MRRFVLAVVALLTLGVVYVLAHWALIEVGREVVVLRTRNADGSWLERRLWVVDAGGYAWVHGGDSHWMHNLEARPLVELERGGVTRRYRAEPVPGPHPRIHELLRAKYGIADWWVRTVGPDNEKTMPVRLVPLDAAGQGAGPRAR